MKLKRVGAIAVTVIAGHCCANPILDQSFISPIRDFVIEGCCSAAQTFTVGIAGTLAQVNLDLRNLHDLPVLGIDRTLQIVEQFPARRPIMLWIYLQPSHSRQLNPPSFWRWTLRHLVSG